jgi:hypothetical protein
MRRYDNMVLSIERSTGVVRGEKNKLVSRRKRMKEKRVSNG